LISESDRKVSDLYDMIHPNANDTLTVRSVFVISSDKKVNLTITYRVWRPVALAVPDT
jgi:alkyl hydroperoxide reductase subunit AhpC